MALTPILFSEWFAKLSLRVEDEAMGAGNQRCGNDSPLYWNFVLGSAGTMNYLILW